MSIAEAWPPAGRPFTVDVLDRMPDDGRRYELLDGVLVVSPAPIIGHQLVIAELSFLLKRDCPDGLLVIPGPGMMVSAQTELVPDIVVVDRADIHGTKLTAPPLLVVEVQSPSTRLFDLNQKKATYESFGVASYWIVVPDRASPALIVFDLRDGRYEEVAHVTGDEALRVARPFPVEVAPARLVDGLPGN